MVTVARRPVTGTSVQNVLSYGCGALGVDGTRILSGDSVTTHSRSPEASKKENRPVYGEYGPVTTHQSRGQALGRWPANLVLQHLEGCGRVGGGMLDSSQDPPRCQDGCPIGDLDEQGREVGVHSAGGVQPSGMGTRKDPRSLFGLGLTSDFGGNRFGDDGGASRFFKRVGTP